MWGRADAAAARRVALMSSPIARSTALSDSSSPGRMGASTVRHAGGMSECDRAGVGHCKICRSMSLVRHFRWDDMPKERVNDQLDRRLITAERMMLAHVYLRKGAIVPLHSHD